MVTQVVAAHPATPPPYTARQAAERLGCSVDLLEKNFAALGGLKVGAKILIPRHTVDALVDGPEAGVPPLQRVIALLPRLSAEARRRVALTALQEAA